jgi:L-rhamnose mutarotase
MIKKAIRMKVFPDKHEDYQKRHDELWPEMREMLKNHGCLNYTIWLDIETSTLFGYLEIEDEILFAQASKTEINQKWWAYMADIMPTNPDFSPITEDLKLVFEL